MPNKPVETDTQSVRVPGGTLLFLGAAHLYVKPLVAKYTPNPSAPVVYGKA